MTHEDLVKLGRQWLSRPWNPSLKRCQEGAKEPDRWFAEPPNAWRICRRPACAVTITEMTTAISETPDVIGWTGTGSSFLLECKASISDFKADQNKAFRRHPSLGIGRFRFYLAPSGLLKPEQIPKGWGLLNASNGGRITMTKPSDVFEYKHDYEMGVFLSLLRRMKVKPGKHVNIRAYTVDDKEKEPRATVTFRKVRKS